MQDRVVRATELKEIIGLSRTSVWRLENSGEFPKRRQISPGAVGWLHSEVIEWLESRQRVGGGDEL